jgi:hypothetical protein
MTGHNAITGNNVGVHVEISTAVFNQCIDLLERTLVKEHFHALSCGHLATVMLSINPRLATSCLTAGLPIAQILESLLCR